MSLEIHLKKNQSAVTMSLKVHEKKKKKKKKKIFFFTNLLSILHFRVHSFLKIILHAPSSFLYLPLQTFINGKIKLSITRLKEIKEIYVAEDTRILPL